jgi:hypothetical protein
MSGRSDGERVTKREPLVIETTARGPLRKPCERFLGQLSRAHHDADLTVRVRSQVPGSHHLAVLNEGHLIASDFDFAEEMGIEEDGCATLALCANDVAH